MGHRRAGHTSPARRGAPPGTRTPIAVRRRAASKWARCGRTTTQQCASGFGPPVSPKAPMNHPCGWVAAARRSGCAQARLHFSTVPRIVRKPLAGGARFDRGGGALETGRRRLGGRHGYMRPYQAKQANLANRVDNYSPVPAGSNPQAHKPREPGPIPRTEPGAGSNRNRRSHGPHTGRAALRTR